MVWTRRTTQEPEKGEAARYEDVAVRGSVRPEEPVEEDPRSLRVPASSTEGGPAPYRLSIQKSLENGSPRVTRTGSHPFSVVDPPG